MLRIEQLPCVIVIVLSQDTVDGNCVRAISRRYAIPFPHSASIRALSAVGYLTVKKASSKS